VQPGQGGTMLLYGLTSAALPFVVQRVTPVAQVDGGRNTFRIEGALADGAALDSLRPGMEGIGKIEIGERSVAAVWTRSLVDWVRNTAWAWTP